MAEVGLDRGLADPETGADGTVRASVGDQPQHLDLAGAELPAGIPARREDGEGGRGEGGTPGGEVVDGAQHVLASGVLEQEIPGAFGL